MKNKILLIGLIFLNIVSVFSQSYEWGTNIGQWTNDIPIDIDKTSDGILITTSANGFETKGLYKYDPEGNVIWEFDFFDEYENYGFLGSVVDENDNIYAILFKDGNAGGSIVVDGITIHNGVSLLKINDQGEVEWNKKIGGQSTGVSILHKNNSIYVLGQFYGELNIDDSIVLNSSTHWDCIAFIDRIGEDFYAAKFNLNGELLNAKNFGEDYPDFLSSATIDAEENIYLTGVSDNHSCTEPYTHITKLDEDLNILWNKPIGYETRDSRMLLPSNIYYSQNERIYLWGYHNEAVIHEDYTLPVSNCTDLATNQGFSSNIFEFNSQDGSFIKYKTYTTCTVNHIWPRGSFSTIGNNNGFIADLDENNLIVFTSFNRPVEFENGTYEPTSQTTQYDEFFYEENLLMFKVSKEDFKTEYITSFYGDLSSEYAETSTDNPGPILMEGNDIYLTASFQGDPLYVLDGIVRNNSGNNNTDILFSKINLENVLSIPNFQTSLRLSTYPNPVESELNFSSENQISSIQIYSTSGKLVKEYSYLTNESSINLSDLQQGIYFGKFTSKDQIISTKKIIKR